jgi:hypothetical protein
MNRCPAYLLLMFTLFGALAVCAKALPAVLDADRVEHASECTPKLTIRWRPSDVSRTSTVTLWGASGTKYRGLDKFQVLQGNAQLHVPASAWFDLANLLKVQTLRGANECVIVLSGGESARSYTAYLYFSNGILKRRRVHSASFPDEAWEETVYQPNLSSR